MSVPEEHKVRALPRKAAKTFHPGGHHYLAMSVRPINMVSWAPGGSPSHDLRTEGAQGRFWRPTHQPNCLRGPMIRISPASYWEPLMSPHNGETNYLFVAPLD
jgi:hypothetical protein